MTHFRDIKLTPKDIKEFQRIYLSVYEEVIDEQEAEIQARRFLRFMSLVMK